jgi:hypothetical protein
MVSLEDAVAMTGQTPPMLRDSARDQNWHCCESQPETLVCLNSLLKIVVSGNSCSRAH